MRNDGMIKGEEGMEKGETVGGEVRLEGEEMEQGKGKSGAGEKARTKWSRDRGERGAADGKSVVGGKSRE